VRQTGKIVYLDQNAWIDLAKSDKKTRTFVTNLSENGAAIFPLSLAHVEETSRISNPQRRQKLASLMVEVSRGYSFSPLLRTIIEMEVRQLVMERRRLPFSDLRKNVLGKGMGHLVGAEPKIEWSPTGINPSQTEKLKKEMLSMLDTPDSLLLILTTVRRPPFYPKVDANGVEKLEKIRKDFLRIKDNALRRRAIFTKFLLDFMTPILARVSYEMQLPTDFFIKKGSTEQDFRDLLDSVPTALCFFTLLLERDQQLQRPIQANDLNDIWTLSLAIPYSHIVVTENMWVSISQQTKIDRKCRTLLLTSIKELLKHLQNPR
jgi:hypothetical protein